MPFSVSLMCSWLVFWCLKWMWSLPLPGFPGAFETSHVKNDKGYCDFSVVCFLFPLKIYWLLWAQSSVAGWDGLNFQHLFGALGQTKKSWYFDRKLFFKSLLACRFQQFVWNDNCLVAHLQNQGKSLLMPFKSRSIWNQSLIFLSWITRNPMNPFEVYSNIIFLKQFEIRL